METNTTIPPDETLTKIISLVKSGQLEEAEDQIENLYAANLDSPSIHLLRADLLMKLGRPEEAHHALEVAYKFTPDNLEVLKRVAASRDAYGSQAAAVYEELAKKLESENAPASEVIAALNRGMVVAMRDGEKAEAQRMAEKLRAHGESTALPGSTNQNARTFGLTNIPGGIKALARMAGMADARNPDLFLTQYAERLVRLHDKGNYADSLEVYRSLHEYFKIVVELQSLTSNPANASGIRLETQGKSSQNGSERILFLLGWQVKKQQNRFTLEWDNRQVLAYRKQVSNALGINADELKSTLESGQVFKFNIPTDQVPILLGENYWTSNLINGSKSPGGFAEALLDTLQAAYLYVAFGNFNPETLLHVTEAFNPKALVKEHWRTFYLYGGALSIEKGRIEIPGGEPASGAWDRLVGTSHLKLNPFLNSLVSKDFGRLMAFYYILAGLPPANQQFFARNPKQLEAFYKAFCAPGKSLPGSDTFLRRNTVFFDVAREIPLNNEGMVLFPGGSGLWKDHRSGSKKEALAAKGEPKAESTGGKGLPADVSRGGKLEDESADSFISVASLSLLGGIGNNFLAPAKLPKDLASNGNLSSRSAGRQKPGERQPAYSSYTNRIKIPDADYANPFPSIQSLRKAQSGNQEAPPSSDDLLKKLAAEVAASSPSDRSQTGIESNPSESGSSSGSQAMGDAKDGADLGEGELKILAELFSNRDEGGKPLPTRLEAFLNMIRLEKHWGQPLDEDSVSLLLDNFTDHKDLFPYLAVLPPLAFAQLQGFFSVAETLDSSKSSDLALIVGDFQCLLKLLSLLHENGALEKNQVTAILDTLCEQFSKATTNADFARSTYLVLESVKQNLQVSLTANNPGKASKSSKAGLAQADLDALLVQALAGVSNPMKVKFGSEELEIDLPSWKKDRMQEVLNLQAIPEMDQVLKLYQQLGKLGRTNQDWASTLGTMDGLISNLRDVDGTLWASVPKNLQHGMIQMNRERILRSLSLLKVSLAKGSSSSEQISNVGKVEEALHPALHLSLLGWIYAYHFAPNDLLIKEDPLFIRRHHFLTTSATARVLWRDTDLDSVDPDSGSYVRGGVAQIAAVAGEVGLTTDEPETAVGRDQPGARLAAAQLAALRAIPWKKWNSRQLQDYCLKVRLGRELLAESSLNPSILTEISDDLRVLVGPTRARLLLQTLPGSTTADSAYPLSSPELYALANAYWKRKGSKGWSKSPLVSQVKAEDSRQGPALPNWAGGYYPHASGCPHAHASSLGSYEEYQNLKDPGLISERLSHVLLDLAEKMDRSGLPLDLLPLVAEPAVRQLGMTKGMSDWSDWQSALVGFRDLRLEPLLSQLQAAP
ncbi:MAG: hypothetical protein U0V70_04920 [Terriglobia bacterium]